MRHEIVSKHTLTGADIEKLVREHLNLEPEDTVEFQFRPHEEGPSIQHVYSEDSPEHARQQDLRKKASKNPRDRMKIGLRVTVEHTHPEGTVATEPETAPPKTRRRVSRPKTS